LLERRSDETTKSPKGMAGFVSAPLSKIAERGSAKAILSSRRKSI
jgi:hypothetical protein